LADVVEEGGKEAPENLADRLPAQVEVLLAE
jgi:hypothetical protein